MRDEDALPALVAMLYFVVVVLGAAGLVLLILVRGGVT